MTHEELFVKALTQLGIAYAGPLKTVRSKFYTIRSNGNRRVIGDTGTLLEVTFTLDGRFSNVWIGSD